MGKISDLVRLQWQMTRKLPLLMQHINELGYECALGDAYRDPRVPYGEKFSLHKLRLAQDLVLWDVAAERVVDGSLPSDVEIWTKLGEYWKSLGGTWGGDFEGDNAGDYNHFSLEYQGRK